MAFHHLRPIDPYFRVPWEQAACRGKPTDWFYPESINDPTITYALALCAACPIRPECYVYAVEAKEVGVWGGENFSKPSRLPTVHRDICGEVRGYYLHHRLREKPCRACKNAANEYKKQQLKQKAAS